MNKKDYEAPELELMEFRVEQGFAASSTIENPQEEAESSDYWS